MSKKKKFVNPGRSKKARNVTRDLKEVKDDLKKMGFDGVAARMSQGELTRRLLKKRKIKSPDTSNKILIKPGFWIKPKKVITTEAQRHKFVQEMRTKFGFDKIMGL